MPANKKTTAEHVGGTGWDKRRMIEGLCGALTVLFGHFVKVGGQPGEMIDSPLCLFEIDRNAAAGADDAGPRYKATDGYLEVCAALGLRIVADRKEEQVEVAPLRLDGA